MRKLKIALWGLLPLEVMAYIIFIYYRGCGWWDYACPFAIFATAMIFILVVWVENNRLQEKLTLREKQYTDALDREREATLRALTTD